MIANALLEKGYDVSFVDAERPLNPNKSDGSRFIHHIAAAVKIGDEMYVINPSYSGGNGLGITTLDEWINKQYPSDVMFSSAYEDPMLGRYNDINENKDISMDEYSAKWLKNWKKSGNNQNYKGFD